LEPDSQLTRVPFCDVDLDDGEVRLPFNAQSQQRLVGTSRSYDLESRILREQLRQPLAKQPYPLLDYDRNCHS
jgi:hypothetical protein